MKSRARSWRACSKAQLSPLMPIATGLTSRCSPPCESACGSSSSSGLCSAPPSGPTPRAHRVSSWCMTTPSPFTDSCIKEIHELARGPRIQPGNRLHLAFQWQVQQSRRVPGQRTAAPYSRSTHCAASSSASFSPAVPYPAEATCPGEDLEAQLSVQPAGPMVLSHLLLQRPAPHAQAPAACHLKFFSVENCVHDARHSSSLAVGLETVAARATAPRGPTPSGHSHV